MADPLLGKKLGDYSIQDLLGRGGMARVYRGYDERLQRYAAVKVISTDSVTSDLAEYTERFRREARSIARLNHPNIVGVYQFGEYDGGYYMAMEFVEGRDLRQILRNYDEWHLNLPVSDVVSIVRGIGVALDYAHSRGVIHRDVKPSNIMLNSENHPVLTDFGLALNASEGTLGDTFGSAHYIAPEQAVSSAKAVAQSDLYSLGVCVFEMLTGKVPFDDPSAMAVALKHLNEIPTSPRAINPDLPAAIDGVMSKILDKDPTRRYETGAQFAQALEAALISNNITDSKATPPGRKTDVTDRKSEIRRLDAKSKTGEVLVPPVTPANKPTAPGTSTQLITPTPAKKATNEVASASKSTPPTGFPSAPTSSEPTRRTNVGLFLLLGLAAVFIIGIFIALSSQSGTPSASGTQTVQPTEVAAVATDDVNGSITASPESTENIGATTPDLATPTEEVVTTTPDSPTNEATLVATEATPDLNATVIASGSTSVPTDVITPEVTPDTALTPTIDPSLVGTAATSNGDKRIRLTWDANQVNVINISKQTVDISQLSFVQHTTPEVRFSAVQWSTARGARYFPDFFPANFCFQLSRSEFGIPVAVSPCINRLAAFLTVPSQSLRQFWVRPSAPEITGFDVVLGDQVIVQCPFDQGSCDVPLP